MFSQALSLGTIIVPSTDLGRVAPKRNGGHMVIKCATQQALRYSRHPYRQFLSSWRADRYSTIRSGSQHFTSSRGCRLLAAVP